MKAGLLCFAGLTAVALAQPRNQHRRHHHAKRDVVYDVVTEIDYATATLPNAVVYVDNNGKPLYTLYEDQPAPTSTSSSSTSTTTPASSTYVAPTSTYVAPSSTSVAPSSSTYVAPSSSTTVSVAPTSTSKATTSEAPAPTTSQAPASSSTTKPAASSAAPTTSSAPAAYSAPASSSTPATTSSAAAATSSAASSGSASGYGIAYSPYHTDGTCKTQSEVNADFARLSGVSMVRTYGTDCDQTATVLSAASAKGIKLFAGVYDITSVASEVQLIISAANGNWANIDTVSIGNEGVNDGTYTVAAVTAAVAAAKTQLKAAGFTGNVVTVDTFVAIIANPALCEVGDYVAANCHAFFDGGVTADQAGTFVLTQAQRVSSACGGKKTVITESGWPWQGETNNKAVPSPANQASAISSLKSAFSSNLILFTAFNDYWKTNNAGTFDAEQYWGIVGDSASTPP